MKWSIVTSTFIALRKHLVIGKLNGSQFFSAQGISLHSTKISGYILIYMKLKNEVLSRILRFLYRQSYCPNGTSCLKLSKNGPRTFSPPPPSLVLLIESEVPLVHDRQLDHTQRTHDIKMTSY